MHRGFGVADNRLAAHMHAFEFSNGRHRARSPRNPTTSQGTGRPFRLSIVNNVTDAHNLQRPGDFHQQSLHAHDPAVILHGGKCSGFR